MYLKFPVILSIVEVVSLLDLQTELVLIVTYAAHVLCVSWQCLWV